MRKKKKNAAQNCPVETLQTKAADLLAKGRHREAIEAYKQLLKKEQRDEWQAALAKAYLLRAQALANKDMYKEAAVLWENRANLCTDFETKVFPQTTLTSKALLDQYIYWLIRAGRHIKAARLLTDHAEHLPDKVTWQLWSLMGALLLAGETQDLTDVLPDDAILLKHYAIIEAALEAYYRGYHAITEEHLKQIPFRSPYRDFRPILKALLIFHSDPNVAHQLLKKVPTDSPYSNFAKLIQLAGEDKESLLEGLSKRDRYEQAFIAQLKGWDKGRMKVISMLQTAAKRESNKALMEVVVTHHQTFGESYSRKFCMALLPCYPAGIKIYERTYGLLSAFEKNRVAALNYERKGQSSYTAERNWRFCVENLKKHAQEENTALKIALILRHIVELTEKRGETFDNFKIPNDLAESLAYDPDDKSSYLKLTQWYQHQNDQKNYQKWIDAAVKQFPKDGEILFLAMEAATRKKAFKKAVGFAKKLLKVDPINVKARQIAQFSHISHARKLIKSGKYSNARLELEQAAHFEKSSQRSGIVQINQGLLELQAEGFVKPKTRTRRTQGQTRLLESPQSEAKQKTIKLLKEGVQLAGGVLLGQFKVIVESKSQALNPADILPLIFPQNKRTPSPTRKELLEWINLINVYTKEGVTFLKEAVHQVKEPLQKALKLDFSQEEMLSLCQCLKNVKHYMLLKQFADNAIKRWAKHPAFFYYQIYAKVRGNIYQLSIPDAERLKDAVENAEKQGDKRTSTMIISFLNQIERPPFFNFFDGDLNEIEDLEDMLPPPDELRKFIERLEEMGIDLSDFDDMPFPHPSSRKKKRKKR